MSRRYYVEAEVTIRYRATVVADSEAHARALVESEEVEMDAEVDASAPTVIEIREET